MNVSELATLMSKLSEYDFEEMTVWDANERWEQHLYLDPSYDHEKIYLFIREHTV